MLSRTTSAMLEALRESSANPAWEEFDARYRPVLIGFGRQLGLSDVDAADAAQETLLEFLQAWRAGRYDRDRGRLRSWILGIARNCIMDMYSKRGPQREQRGMSAIQQLQSPDETAEIWDAEVQRAILAEAMEQLRETTRTDQRTVAAFEMIAMHGVPTDDVARELSMSLNDVYLAKHRCLKRIREIIAELNVLYEVEDD